jgi:Tfp pilus assembly protein PilO
MKISQREMVLGAATIGCLLIGTTWYIVDNKTDEWKAKKTEIEGLEQQISYHQTAIKQQENWKDELDELQKDLRIFGTKQRSVSPELMKTIKSISNRHGLDIVRSQPYSEKPTGDLFELGINCTWEGKLDAMVGFLADLQQQGVRYDVRTLNVQPVGKNTGKLKGNMVIHCAYTRKAAANKNKAKK